MPRQRGAGRLELAAVEMLPSRNALHKYNARPARHREPGGIPGEREPAGRKQWGDGYGRAN